MSSEEVVIDVRDLSKRYEIYATPRDRLKQLVLPRLYQATNRIGVAMGATKHRPAPAYFREFWALRNVSFEVRRGETLGIIGRNGSGKSTLLQIIAGTMASTSGSVDVKGRVAALLELGSGFNPEFSGRENVFLNGRILGLNQREIEDRYDRIVEFADIGEFIDEPVKTYSSGMFLRLAFAVQAHIDAAVVIIDEALAVGDVFFRQKCYSRLEQLRSSGAAILLVSHSMPDIEQYCERAILLDHGMSRFIGPSSEAAKHYYLLHQPQAKNTALPAVTSLSPDALRAERCAPIDRPPPEAFLDLTNKSQISNGQARCIGVAICNSAGQFCTSFRQGDVAVFFYEFELVEEIGVPICGVVIKNDRGVIVHGKNSWQCEGDVPASQGSGSQILCRQEMKLDIGLGEYLFEIGLASVPHSTWLQRDRISHEEMTSKRTRICHIADVGAFSVGFAVKNGIPLLRHHGLADLPGSTTIAVQGGVQRVAGGQCPDAVVPKMHRDIELESPTIFHVTHWKAGSQWLHKILRDLALEKIVPPQKDEQQFLHAPLVRGGVYPTVYVTKEKFHSVDLPSNYTKFVVIRDLRDTLVSGYFSIRYSHALDDERLTRWRRKLEAMTMEDGLLMLLDEWLPMSAQIQQSWLTAGEEIVRYEDLLKNDVQVLERVLIGRCGIQVTPERLRQIVEANRFENVANGRKPGEEDIAAHERKGIAGDWCNYFTPRVSDEFQKRFAGLLPLSGYE